MQKLTGIYPPITTPFRNHEVHLSSLSENIEILNAYELSGYVVLGSNGENVYLSGHECMQIIETVFRTVPDDKKTIIGVGKESTKAAIDFISEAGSIGGSLFLVSTPHYYKGQMTAEALERHFLEIADKSSQMLLLYNVPKFTGIEIPIQTVKRVSNHPNILGMKDSSGNITYQQSLLAMELENFHILTGTANTLLTSLLMGASGAILALANIAPQFCLDIYQAVRAGNLEEARELQLKVIRLNQLTTAIHGIGGLKFALDKLGLKGGLPRSPLTEPNEIGKKVILQELKNLNLIETHNSA